MRELQPGWGLIWRINGSCLGATGGLWVGKFLWDASSFDWWALGLLGLLLMIMGLTYAIRALFLIWTLIVWRTQTRRFGAGHGEQRADAMASRDDLRQRGMTR